MTDLELARAQINEVDCEMARLFEKRMDAVQKIAAYKKEHGLRIDDLTREAEVIAKNSSLIENEEYKPYFVNFLQYNIDLSKSLQHRLVDGMRVAYSGVEGAFADIVASKIFPDAATVPFGDFNKAYFAVVDGKCDCAVLPIENSSNGDVGTVLDLAFSGPLFISGIFEAAIVQNLLANKGASLDTIKQVISHPQALGQCLDFINEKGFEQIEAVNTAVAAKQVAQSGRLDIAAIGSEKAAEMFGLVTLRSHINQSNSNTTRFAVFTRTAKAPVDNDGHFVMLFSVKNEAGSLGQAISIIGEHGFNLRAIKSRPKKELVWDYYFYAEGDGNINSDNGKVMISRLNKCCDNLRVIGYFEKEVIL